MLTLYGLKNCDTCRNAIKWLTNEGIEHRFSDVRKDGVDPALVAGWAKAVGWELLLNRRGTTWRGLPEADKDGVDEAKAIELMVTHPALIKRPVFDRDGAISVGFKDADKAVLKA